MLIRFNILSLLALALTVSFTLSLASCSSDEEDTTSEYYNWKSRNDAYFEKIFQQATDEINSGSEDWYKIMSYSKNDASNHCNYIIVHVLSQSKEVHKEVVDGSKNTSNGLVCPIDKDSCTVTYRGNMMPSASYTTIAPPDNIEVGYQFDTKWYGNDLNIEEATFTKFVPGSGVVEGFGTALQYMHPGDRWRVYIPYRLGYGSSSNGSVQAYSTLIFDVYLKSFKTKQK